MTSGPQRWRSLYLQAAERRWLRNRPGVLVTFVLASAGFVAALWLAGFPLWRVAALAGTMALIGALLVAVYRNQLSPDGQARVHPVVAIGLVACMALTGGLYSPFLSALVVLAQSQRLVNDVGKRSFWVTTIALTAVTLALALLGTSISPAIPEPLYTVFTAVFLATALLIASDRQDSLAQAIDMSTRELLWMRDQATTRARELELMSSRLSHELKNPLAAIKALVQVSARTTPDPKTRERLEVVEREVVRMSCILQDYLTLSRPMEELKLFDARLEDVVDDVLSVLEARAAATQIRLGRRGGVAANVDAPRLKEALVNLVTNAIDASDARSRIVTVHGLSGRRLGAGARVSLA